MDDTPEKYVLTATFNKEEVLHEIAERCLASFYDRYDDRDSLREHIKMLMRDRVAQIIQEYTQAITEQAVADATQDLIQNGWTKTDNYGREVGDRVTIKGLVIDYLTKPKDSYHPARAFKMADDLIEKHYKEDLKELVEQCKQRLRNLLNTKLDDALRSALLSSLGIRD